MPTSRRACWPTPCGGTNRGWNGRGTPHTWRTPKALTVDPLEKAKVEPYAAKSLKAYADTLTDTLNAWAEKERSTYRVRAQGGTDEQTGLAMVTIKVSDDEAPFRYKAISSNFAEQLDELHRLASKDHGTLIYERDIFLFQGEQVHIVRPNILLNWTRTAALNDAARIYGDIALSREGM